MMFPEGCSICCNTEASSSLRTARWGLLDEDCNFLTAADQVVGKAAHAAGLQACIL
jgi:hypothetical protein